jgi:hypothetical protein
VHAALLELQVVVLLQRGKPIAFKRFCPNNRKSGSHHFGTLKVGPVFTQAQLPLRQPGVRQAGKPTSKAAYRTLIFFAYYTY